MSYCFPLIFIGDNNPLSFSQLSFSWNVDSVLSSVTISATGVVIILVPSVVGAVVAILFSTSAVLSVNIASSSLVRGLPATTLLAK